MTNIKNDALYVMLVNFAHKCDNKGDFIIAKMVKALVKASKKPLPFSTSKKLEIDNYLKNIVDPKLEELKAKHDGKTSPQILMILTIDLLINEHKHLITRRLLSHLYDQKLIDDIYSLPKFKEYIKTHSDFIGSI